MRQNITVAIRKDALDSLRQHLKDNPDKEHSVSSFVDYLVTWYVTSKIDTTLPKYSLPSSGRHTKKV